MEQSSYLQYLPAIFHKKPELDNEIPFGDYLLPYEVILNQFDQLLATLDEYFAPELAPAEAFLSWLATWVALSLDEEWEDLERRLLIQEAVELYRWRGTIRGLKRYLALYAKVPEEQVEIEEARWPGGMQIGVASRIGHMTTVSAEDVDLSTNPETSKQEYYIVTTVAPTDHPCVSEHHPDAESPQLPEGTPLILYYDTSRVECIEIEDEQVTVYYRPTGADAAIALCHKNPNEPVGDEPPLPNITRTIELTNYRYVRLSQTAQNDENDAPNPMAVKYQGGSFLIDTIPAPYHFIVHLAPSKDDDTDKLLSRVRKLLNLEKPAHTDYYLKLSPDEEVDDLERMQIEVRSSIGLDTAIG